MSTDAVVLKLITPMEKSIEDICKEAREQNLNPFVSQLYSRTLEFDGFPNAHFPIYVSWLDHLATNLFFECNVVDDFIRARVDPKFYWSIEGHEFILADPLKDKSYSSMSVYDLHSEAKYDVYLGSCNFFKYQEAVCLIKHNPNFFVEEMEKTFVEGEMYLSFL